MYICYMKTIYIYSLSCPLSDEIRYIGKTNSIERRLRSHIDYAKNKKVKKRPVSVWILELLKKGLKPNIKVLEETTENLSNEKEIFWIAEFKEKKSNLCNITNGGNTGFAYSDELKEIRRKARLGTNQKEETKILIKQKLSRKVYSIDDDLVFESMNEAVLYAGISKTTFHRKFHKDGIINNKTYQWYNQQNK